MSKNTQKLLNEIFYKNGEIVPVKTEILESISYDELREYCHYKGIYQIITLELVEWFAKNIDLNNAIEIGAGNGTLGKALNIPTTDNKMQQWPHVKKHYEISGQPVINYPSYIEQIDAIKAINKYKPKTVIGSWITNKYRKERHNKGGNMYSPCEFEIMQNIDTYYLIGNLEIHHTNILFDNLEKYSIEMIHKTFLLSRRKNKNANFIFKFQNRKNV